jgi:hypothetical protein
MEPKFFWINFKIKLSHINVYKTRLLFILNSFQQVTIPSLCKGRTVLDLSTIGIRRSRPTQDMAVHVCTPMFCVGTVLPLSVPGSFLKCQDVSLVFSS